MWVLFRLLTALVVGLVRYFWRRTAPENTSTTGGISWVYRQATNKGKVYSTTFGIPFKHPVFFRLSRERGIDRFCTAVGFAREMQTGDAAFDDAVYVACDHPALQPVLQADEQARTAILRLLGPKENVTRIFADGEHLWAHRRGNNLPDAGALHALARVRNALQEVPTEQLRLLRDPFFWRAGAVEALAWSLAFYGAPAILERAFEPHPQYFSWGPVIQLGLIASVFAFALLIGIAWLLLRRSSRAHRVFVESALVLALGVPLSSIEVVSDLNIALDSHRATLIEPAVTSKYTRVTTGRRGRKRTHYHLVVAPPHNASVVTPANIEVSGALYNAAREGGHLRIALRSGALGLTWVESIQPIP